MEKLYFHPGNKAEDKNHQSSTIQIFLNSIEITNNCFRNWTKEAVTVLQKVKNMVFFQEIVLVNLIVKLTGTMPNKKKNVM